MAALSWMPSVSHASLNYDRKAMMERCGQRGEEAGLYLNLVVLDPIHNILGYTVVVPTRIIHKVLFAEPKASF